jgi:hypothetical protein
MTEKTYPAFLSDLEHYYLALGAFIDRFAIIEMLLTTTLARWAEVTDDVARAIFSGVRFDAATSYITRILAVSDVPQSVKDEYQDLFTQLGHINALGNSIVHYGTEFNANKSWLTSNCHSALSEDRVRTFPVSTDILAEAIHDLRKARAHLLHLIGPTFIPDAILSSYVGQSLLRAPWQYKPPAPASPNDKRPATPLAPQLPRLALRP